MSDHLKGAMRNAKRCGEERLKVREELEVKLEKLKQGTSIRGIEDTIGDLVKNLGQEMTSYLQSHDVKSSFCTWEESDLPHIDDRHRTNTAKIKETYSRCIEERFQSFLENWENREKLFAKAYEDLERQFHQSFYDFEQDIRDIDLVLVGESSDELTPLGIPQGGLLSPLHPNMKKFLVITLGIFVPVLIPVGLAVGVLSAPVVGWLAIDKRLKERHLKRNPCQALTELSTEFLEAFINEKLLLHVRDKFSEETSRIASIKRCHQHLITRYEQRCKELTRDEDESRDKETLEKFGPLNARLQEMNKKLTFDAIQSGIQVMYPPCQIDIKRLLYDERGTILGAGTYGAVFKGKFTPPGRGIRDVAVKKLREAPSPSNVVSFLHEAATVK